LSILVNKVGKRLLKASGYENLYDWKFQVLDINMVNAFAAVGGKIYICTGILPYLKDDRGHLEEGLASVLGHEIGHAIASKEIFI
jgi:predicted Zn-dependent protease